MGSRGAAAAAHTAQGGRRQRRHVPARRLRHSPRPGRGSTDVDDPRAADGVDRCDGARRRVGARRSPDGGRRGRRPRLRRAVLAADRAPRTRVRRLQRAAAPPRRGRGGPAAQAEGPDPLRRAGVGLRRRRAASSTRSCSSSASRCWASVTACSSLALKLGGKVEGAEVGEFGRSELHGPRARARLLAGLPAEQTCWMSHRDTVYEAPPGFTALASSTESPVAAFESTERGHLRHPVPPRGRPHARTARTCSSASCGDVCGCDIDWSAASIVEEQIERIRAQVGDAKVICGLSRRRGLVASPRCSSTRRSATSSRASSSTTA